MKNYLEWYKECLSVQSKGSYVLQPIYIQIISKSRGDDYVHDVSDVQNGGDLHAQEGDDCYDGNHRPFGDFPLFHLRKDLREPCFN